jgi:VWFA-related protein
MLVTSLAAAYAQQPAFLGAVTQVEVDVVVVDDGAFVTDLTEQDFEILEDGQPRAINSFSLVDLPIPNRGSRASAPDPLESDVATNTTDAQGRIWVMVLDSARTPGILEVRQWQRVARQFVEEALGPDDQMAVVQVRRRMDASQPFTRSRARILASIDKFDDPPLGEYSRVGGTALDTYYVLRYVAETLGAISGRRKAIVWIGGSLPFIPPMSSTPSVYPGAEFQSVLAAHRDAMRAAQRNNVAIHPVSGPGGLTGQAALRVVAEDTGGIAMVNTNDYSRGFASIVRDNSTYYVLGYDTEDHRDGQFHRITVRVKRDGVTVRARPGYLAPEPEKAARAAEAAARPGADVAEALRNPLPRPGLPLSIVAVPFPGLDSDGSVVVAAHVRGTAVDGDLRADVAYRAIDAEGDTLLDRATRYEVPLTSDGRARVAGDGFGFIDRVRLPRGRHEIRFAVHLDGGETGSVVTYVDVPDFTRGRAALSGLLVRSATEGSGIVFTGDGSEPEDVGITLERHFSRSSRARVHAEAYVDAEVPADRVTFAASVRPHPGQDEATQVAVTSTGVEASASVRLLTFDLPLSSLEPGAYVLTLDVLIRGERRVATRQLTFWITED